MSWFVLFFIIVIVSIVTSEEVGVNVTCVSVNFENGLENFDDSTGQCSAIRSPWEVGHYADINIPPPHESSTTFIKPDGTSCVSSFQFKISATGTLEVTFYMLNGFLSITVNEIRDMGPEVQTNSEVFSSSTPGVVNDSWNTKNITVGSFGTFWGYVSIEHYYIVYFLFNSFFSFYFEHTLIKNLSLFYSLILQVTINT